MEMIKGIQGHGYYDELVVPIIENTAHERELTDSLAKAVCSIYAFWFCYYSILCKSDFFDFKCKLCMTLRKEKLRN